MTRPFLFIQAHVAFCLGKVGVDDNVLSNVRMHLPKLYLGMEHAKLNNWKLAKEFLLVAMESCPSDPQLHNELGVVAYNNEEYTVFLGLTNWTYRYDAAIAHFNKVLQFAQEAGTPLRLWASTQCNLGHAYRRQKYIFHI